MNKKVNIAIVGLGNIGSYFYDVLNKNQKNIFIKTGKIPHIKYVSAKSFKKKRKIKIPKKKWFLNPLNLVKSNNIDIIVELIGGADGMAKKLVFAALKNKKHVITANKALIAKHGDHLAILAEKNKVNLEYEASVAGGVPIIRSIKEGLIANKINKICGILNGTTNYILSSMEDSGETFTKVLEKAKKLGFAETNPTSDLDGSDSSAKLRILSSLAFNRNISKNKILCEGIESLNSTDIYYAKKFNYKIKLLSISEIIKNRLVERVHPCLISNKSFLANVDNVLNAIVIDGNPVGKSILQGEGAGPGPTTSALISDLCSVLRGNIKYPFGVSSTKRKNISKFNILKHISSSYFRIEVRDIPGVLSSITKIFAKNKISIKNLLQNADKRKKVATIIIITHENLEKNYMNLLSNINKNKFVLKKPTFIRIEKV